MTWSDEETLIRATISRDGEVPDDIPQRLGEKRAFTLLASATALAVDRKFPTGVDSAAIQDYVQDLKRRFPNGASQIKPMVAEAVIRATKGEDQLLEGISSQDVNTMLFVLPYAIMSDENLTGEPLDEFVAQVLEQADAEE